ncbi:MAG: hypothetical protein IKL03_07865, partial [Bacteroidaceae bacterium]|nr:hypothetical protein [Bacteroidaceae bacterium]
YENESFIPGHEYLVYVYLITEDGYEFAYTSKYYENATTASINGYVGEVNIWEGYWSSQRRVSCSFTCQGKKITTVMVNGLETPKAGKTPDYTATVAYPEWYRLDPIYAGTNGIVWSDEEGHQLDPSDTFEAGKKYRVELKLIPAQLDGANTCQFVAPVSAYVNGKQVIEDGSYDAVYTSTNAVYINYTFPKAAEYAGVTVSGSVTSFNDASGKITLQLIPEGSSEVAYETIVYGNTANYLFAGVAAGTYTLKVSKANHVTREYTIVVGDTTILQDVKIHLLGDINGDGSITTLDYARANSHTKKASTLTGYELLCADVVAGDGNITTADAARINAHVKGTSSLW